MDFPVIGCGLSKEYPYMVTFPFERTSSLDGGYNEPILCKTLKAAYRVAMVENRSGFFSAPKIQIRSTFEEVQQKAERNEWPILGYQTEDFGIIERTEIHKSTPQNTRYMLPNDGTTSYVLITHEGADAIWCPGPRQLCYAPNTAVFGPAEIPQKYPQSRVLHEQNPSDDVFYSAIVNFKL